MIESEKLLQLKMLKNEMNQEVRECTIMAGMMSIMTTFYGVEKYWKEGIGYQNE